MTYGICLSKEIESAHYLTSYKGKPEPVHGHTWKIEVFIEGPLNTEDYLLDFIEVENFFLELNKNFDHNCFNNHPYFQIKSPTTENIAFYYFEEFKTYVSKFPKCHVVRVNVWEGKNNFAYVKV